MQLLPIFRAQELLRELTLSDTLIFLLLHSALA